MMSVGQGYWVYLLAWVVLHFTWQGLFLLISWQACDRIMSAAPPQTRYRAACFHLTALAAAPPPVHYPAFTSRSPGQHVGGPLGCLARLGAEHQPSTLTCMASKERPMRNSTFSRFEVSELTETNGSTRRLAIACLVAIVALLLGQAALGITVPVPASDQTIAPERAAQYFAEAEALSRQDGGRLWGVSLYGPIILVDPESHQAVANQADGEGRLTKSGKVFVGKLPPSITVANTAIDWAGVHWTMVMWPLTEDPDGRALLMMHECFHRIQDALGMPAASPVNAHLESREGRIWMLLEWRALEAALEETGAPRKAALDDALLFRAYRQSLFPKAAEEERALEMNEGLAEYTGVKLSTRSISEMTALAACGLRQAREWASLARSFAYDTGPAYGALLDSSGADWRSQVRTTRDFAALTRAAYNLAAAAPSAERALVRARAYRGEYVIATETERDRVFQERVVKYRATFLSGPVLILPMGKTFNYSFDPSQTLPLDDTKTIYFSSRVTDDWGILEAPGGVLLVREGQWRVQVPAPAKLSGTPLQGDGWTLTLQNGWLLAPSARAGDYVLKPEKGRP